MHITRDRIVILLTLMIICLLVYINCWPSSAKKQNADITGSSIISDKQEQFNVLMDSYHERILLLQTKFLLGIKELSSDLTASPEIASSGLRFGDQEINKMIATFISSFKNNPALPEPGIKQLAKYLSVAKYFKHQELINEICSNIQLIRSEEPLVHFFNDKCLYEQTISKLDISKQTWQLSDEDKNFLQKELNWFGDLLVYANTSENSKDKVRLFQEIIVPTKDFAFKFSAFVGIISVAFLFCIIILPIIIIQLIRGKFIFRSILDKKTSTYLLEAFMIYLGSMLLISKGLEKINLNISPAEMLRLNIILISSFGLYTLWPLFFKIPFKNLISNLGIPNFLPHKFIYEIFIGIFSYIMYLPIMLLVLALYSMLLTKLNIDPSGGTHPIVPLITGKNENGSDSGNIFNLVFILAVFVAPVIEEIMFRGAFYSWLRSRLPIALSILLSAIIFAAVHPQGAIGILPLTCIGILLAFLREWRGKLTASMTAHACNNALMLLIVNFLFR